MSSEIGKIWCIVPAAGIGLRFGENRPKQYLPFRSSTIIDTTIKTLLLCTSLEKVIVCLHPDDEHAQQSDFIKHPRVHVVIGGNQRSDSVLNGLQSIQTDTAKQDWVLVHDAARPCVRLADINKLISEAQTHQQGSILAVPIHDTIKEVDNELAVRTLDRTKLWRALTPQLFKLSDIQGALLSAKKQSRVVTDEASAIEQLGLPVRIVEGHADNIKITVPADLQLANMYMDQQEEQSCA
ncbi:MAG TPA: 2-C-methyl-D-erythritol 4-phosphate cytidylyltransferase [Cycloclasticus sp.]|jgi:2-C-methyl-D-erythritol 4-phosphate cytidylyltransferase|nr:2-C-methyl-D-erythritol 4-phosphate cytidylyltransferase [Cycloclasticus sp.]HIL92534.1 2-C-methyl-D-erythritol 4-phosphate cytidylyltransferase [Cycloclasticus sp.]